MPIRTWYFALLLAGSVETAAAGATEFCLDGAFNLGARYQGMNPKHAEFVDTQWCVITEAATGRVRFAGAGKSNPDLDGSWTVAYLPPDQVRIVNRDTPPDIVFLGVDSRAEANRNRRIDPRRLAEELAHSTPAGIDVELQDGRVKSVRTEADLPLRGTVPVTWTWDWAEPDRPTLGIRVDGELFYTAHGRWRDLDDAEAARVWRATPGKDPVEVPGEHWPSRVRPQLQEIGDGAWLVRGVRTGFRHLVLDTEAGLVVADAPAGWVELHQLPPADLVPGLGISGLSEGLIDFLAAEFPQKPIRAVVLTHAHDDHAGGARAFAAVGADVYAPAAHAGFLEKALNRKTMPPDRLSAMHGRVTVRPVATELLLGDATNPVQLLATGAGPHTSASLAVYAPAAKLLFVSDLHVPSSDQPAPTQNRAQTECWFAAWATAQLPGDVQVLNSHSAQATPVSRLAAYLESAACQSDTPPAI